MFSSEVTPYRIANNFPSINIIQLFYINKASDYFGFDRIT